MTAVSPAHRDTSAVEVSTAERILDACHHLFAERGASNVSVDDVAKAAGVGRATIYRHFADREEMVDAAVSLSRRRLVAQMQQVVVDHESFVDRVAAIAAIFAGVAADTRIDTRRRDLHDHHLAEMFVAGMDRILTDTAAFVTPLVAEGIERGELAPEAIDVGSYTDWVTRMLVSVLLVPGSTVTDIRDPDQVAAYVRANLLAGRTPASD